MLIGYTALSLYMQHRIDKKYKAFKKRLDELENKLQDLYLIIHIVHIKKMIDKDKYLELYDKHGANVAAACKAMGGMSRNTFYLWYREDEDFKQRADAIRESLIDYAESKLQEDELICRSK